MSTTANPLYTPPDTEEAYHRWGANCGPAALAAILGCPIGALRAYFEQAGFIKRRYCNPTHMSGVLARVGRPYRQTNKDAKGHAQMPTRHGLAFLQFGGPVIDKMPVAAQYRHTHWIGVHKLEASAASRVGSDYMIYDVNGGWMPHCDWDDEICERLLCANRADWVWLRTAYEVTHG